jgi:hypothetical protein
VSVDFTRLREIENKIMRVESTRMRGDFTRLCVDSTMKICVCIKKQQQQKKKLSTGLVPAGLCVL